MGMPFIVPPIPPFPAPARPDSESVDNLGLWMIRTPGRRLTMAAGPGWWAARR